MSLGDQLFILLAIAWLLPLLGFAVEIWGGYWGPRARHSKTAAYLACGCIIAGFVSSTAALVTWGEKTDWVALHAEHGTHTEAHPPATEEEAEHEEAQHEHETAKTTFAGKIYTLASFGPLEVSLDYYIDSLTLVMFVMVTFIASCIHVFAIGYMSEELTEDYVDHEVHTSTGGHFHRPGRFYKFFSYLSLFSFSMLGLVIAGNIFQVFIFWELVGICSYLLIGFYVERKSASTAANKAFIMNRVGDFGFLIGLMILWTSFGTFKFFDHEVQGEAAPGLFTVVRGHDGEMVFDDEADPQYVYQHDAEGNLLMVVEEEADAEGNLVEVEKPVAIEYWLLVVAGLGIFAGCVGKSAQFPLQTWLPDAMEGPTPVSALVHSATMVAAGVYLVGRFYPMFTAEVLLVIAYVGCITLFLAATIAIVATDIKRVLAYSTISQLGYMMLALGVGGWGAGLFHLITHAFFKSLMFLASGSVIYGCHHVQEMPQMGGLRKKMPITAYTMLVGVIAIAGLAIPGTAIAFSGYHSKDAIVATALAYNQLNPAHFLLFLLPLVTAGITAFYMFRLWFYTFAGEPRDQHVYDHAKESPLVMTVPLILLAVLAAGCAIGGEGGYLYSMLRHSESIHVAEGAEAMGTAHVSLPGHDAIHKSHSEAGAYALIAAILGTLVAYLLYGARLLNPAEIAKRFSGLYNFLIEKWQFDALYDAMFVRPVHIVAKWATAFDRVVLDGFLHWLCRFGVGIATLDRKFDETFVDGLVNWVGRATQSVGTSMRTFQTGRLRQYIMFIALGVIGLFVLMFALFPKV